MRDAKAGRDTHPTSRTVAQVRKPAVRGSTSTDIRPAGKRRLTPQEALELLQHEDLLTLGWLANKRRRELHPEPIVTFVIDRNVNYTNICACVCDFCAFYRKPGSPEGYTLPYETIHQKLSELTALGGTQVLMQGGVNPDLPLEFYTDLFQQIKKDFPHIQLHALSPVEIWFIARKRRLSIRETLLRLQEAGLGSIPGGGAEILSDRVRKLVTKGKIDTRDWLDVMRTAHQLGLRSSATMVIGGVETVAERIEHLRLLRELQDETGGFIAFVVWTMQVQNTGMPQDLFSTGSDYLRMLAVARLYLDNVTNFQASWVTQGLGVAQVSLEFGANDFGGTMMEENVVSATGLPGCPSLGKIVRTIRDAGYTPMQRNTLYEHLHPF